jgi:hypothetical protein
MHVSLKQKAAGVAAAIAVGLATIGATTVPAFAHGGGGGGGHGGGAAFVGGGGFHGGGGGFHGGGGFIGGGFHDGGFHGGIIGGARIGDPHFGGGERFHAEAFHRDHGDHFRDRDRNFVGFGGGYYGYYDCGSPYALTNPYVCSYPDGY